MPGLGLKRGLADDLVVAPYATALASVVDPGRRRLELRAAGACGPRRPVRLLRGGGLPAAPAGGARGSRRRPAARGPVVVRAVLRPPPGHVARRARQRRPRRRVRDAGSTPIHASRPPSCCSRSACRAKRSCPSRGRPKPRRAAAVAPAFASRRFQSAAHHQSAHALPVERPLHRRADARRRRLQRLARPRRHPPARRSDLRRGRALHLPARSRGRAASGRPRTCRSAPSRTTSKRRSSSTRSRIRRRDGDFETQLQVAVSPEDDVEVRRLSITNRGDRQRELEVTSYAEIVLARPEDDFAHPAFGKLFVETEFDSQSAGLLCSAGGRVPRTNRRTGRSTCWAWTDGWAGPSSGKRTAPASWAGDGRRPTPRPSTAGALSGTTGAVLDPVAALRERIRLAPGAFVRMTFATGVAPSRAAAVTLMQKYRDGSAAARVLSMAFTHAHITLQHLGLSDDQAMLFDRVGVTGLRRRRVVHQPERHRGNTLGQANLWGHGISGDLPIVLVRVTDAAGVPLARQLLHAQEYWRVEEPARRPGDPERATGRLPRRGAGVAGKPGAGAALRGVERQARRRLPAAHRRHAGRRLPPPDRRRARRAPQRPRRPGAAARSPGPVAATRSRRACPRPSSGGPTPRRSRSRRPPLVMENGLGGLHARRPRVRHRPRRRSRDAAAVVERAGQSRSSARS